VASQYTLRLAWALVYQGVLVSGFNFVVNLWLLKHYRPSTLAPFLLTTPLFGIFLTWWVLGEPLTVFLLAGAVLVAGGIGLALLPGGKSRRPQVPLAP
jgi:drug/metabolite transporter (DMT)-like permease